MCTVEEHRRKHDSADSKNAILFAEAACHTPTRVSSESSAGNHTSIHRKTGSTRVTNLTWAAVRA